MSVVRKSIKGIGWILGTVFVVIMLLSFLSGPESKGLFGYRGYIILSGSMESVLTPGDFIVVKAEPYKTIKKNDIVTFKVDNEVITHRVVKLSTNGLTTKGDANKNEDSSQLTSKDYIGSLKLAIPYLGRLLIVLQKPYMLTLYIGLVGVLFIFSAFEKKKK